MHKAVHALQNEKIKPHFKARKKFFGMFPIKPNSQFNFQQ